jgi:hypothetical protein
MVDHYHHTNDDDGAELECDDERSMADENESLRAAGRALYHDVVSSGLTLEAYVTAHPTSTCVDLSVCTITVLAREHKGVQVPARRAVASFVKLFPPTGFSNVQSNHQVPCIVVPLDILLGKTPEEQAVTTLADIGTMKFKCELIKPDNSPVVFELDGPTSFTAHHTHQGLVIGVAAFTSIPAIHGGFKYLPGLCLKSAMKDCCGHVAALAVPPHGDRFVVSVYNSPSTVLVHHTHNTTDGDCGTPFVYANKVFAWHVARRTAGNAQFNMALGNPLNWQLAVPKVALEGDDDICDAAVELECEEILDLIRVYDTKEGLTAIAPPHLPHPFDKVRLAPVGKPRVVMGTCNNIEGDAAYVPPDTRTCAVEEGRSVTRGEVDTTMVNSAMRSIKTLYNRFTAQASELSYARFAPKNQEERYALYLYTAMAMARPSAIGPLFAHFRLPNTGETTKRSFMLKLFTGPREQVEERVAQFMQLCDDAFAFFSKEHPEDRPLNVPILCYGKNEPITKSKAAAGRHRTIKEMLYFCTIVQSALTWFLPKGGQLPLYTQLVTHYYKAVEMDNTRIPAPPAGPLSNARTHDEIAGACAFGTTGTHVFPWLIGLDYFNALPSMSALGAQKSYMADVSGWDKALPEPLVRALFDTILGKVGVNIHRACNCSPLLYVSGQWMRGAPMTWCSGNPLTLFGNTLMHAAILNGLKCKKFFVQGDDVVMFDPSDVKALINRYQSLGLRLKHILAGEGAYEFCQLYVLKDGRRALDMVRLAARMILKGTVSDTVVIPLLNRVSYVSRGSAKAFEGHVTDGVLAKIREMEVDLPEFKDCV